MAQYYYWMAYNTTTGELGTHSSTHPPLDSSGKFDMNLLLSGFEVIGPYNDSDNPMPSDFKTAFGNSQAYLYQNGAFVANPKYSQSAIDLAQAKMTQIALIEKSYAGAIAAGFTSSATGTAETYAVTAEGITDAGLARSIAQADYPASGIEVELMSGDWSALSYSQMQTYITDLQNFYMPLRSKRIKLTQQIKSSSTNTVSAVQAITW